MKSVLCDPEILLGDKRIGEEAKLTLTDAIDLPDNTIVMMVRSKLRNISEEEAHSLCVALAKDADPEILGSFIKQLATSRIQKIV